MCVCVCVCIAFSSRSVRVSSVAFKSIDIFYLYHRKSACYVLAAIFIERCIQTIYVCMYVFMYVCMYVCICTVDPRLSDPRLSDF